MSVPPCGLHLCHTVQPCLCDWSMQLPPYPTPTIFAHPIPCHPRMRLFPTLLFALHYSIFVRALNLHSAIHWNDLCPGTRPLQIHHTSNPPKVINTSMVPRSSLMMPAGLPISAVTAAS